jgi:hypothetical protein
MGMEYNGTGFRRTRMNSEEPRKLSPTTAGRLSGLSIEPWPMRNFRALRADFAFPRLGVGIHPTILDRRRPSQLFTRSGHWDHKLAVLLGDEISARARRRAFGAFLINGDH